MSEELLRVSEGTAAVLGLKALKTDAAPTTAYFMVGAACARDCAFCAQARGATGVAGRLSRVTWPEYPLSTIMAALEPAVQAGRIRRACVQTVAASGALASLIKVLAAIGRAAPEIEISASVHTERVEDLAELFLAGLDRAGLALDVASAAQYPAIKGGPQEHALGTLAAAASRFPGRVSTHLICGLGETERELLTTLAWCRDRGITVALFAFTPVRGTRLGEREPPPLDVYRRVQAAAYLLRHGHVSLDDLAFDDAGKIAGLGLALPVLREVLAGGVAFETSGCRDCNRPYYNERPGGVMYNYPRPLTPAEAADAVAIVLSTLAASQCSRAKAPTQ